VPHSPAQQLHQLAVKVRRLAVGHQWPGVACPHRNRPHDERHEEKVDELVPLVAVVAAAGVTKDSSTSTSHCLDVWCMDRLPDRCPEVLQCAHLP
jgi:hypothetical protein